MTKELISKQCFAEREQLIGKYCDALPTDHAMPIEQIRELIVQIEKEYKFFLCGIWEQVKDGDNRSLDAILDKRWNRTVLAREYTAPIKTAIEDAEEITLWEKITNSNYRDMAHLNSLIIAYVYDLLAHITRDFLEDVK